MRLRLFTYFVGFLFLSGQAVVITPPGVSRTQITVWAENITKAGGTVVSDVPPDLSSVTHVVSGDSGVFVCL